MQNSCKKSRESWPISLKWLFSLSMHQFKFSIDPNSTKLKYQQLVDAILDSIANNELKEGELLPSINYLIRECLLSRDTIFKAYNELKNRELIVSVPNRGYFVAQSKRKVLLFLDTFKAYKEVLYSSFLEQLPKDVELDLHFHHYNITLFEQILQDNIGKYSSYVIMSFDNERMKEVLGQIPSEKLLIIDWNIHVPAKASVVWQSFGKGLEQALALEIQKINKYKRFVYLYPEFTYHPKESIKYFEKFCKSNNIKHQVQRLSKELDVQKGDLYLLVSDRTLSETLDQCTRKGFILGKDVGIISYNETPMKRFIKDGITVITTDFKQMGQMAASFVKNDKRVEACIPTKLIMRSSV